MVSLVSATAPAALDWDGASLRVLDQTLLPHREEVLELTGADDTAAAIARLAVRGAPLIGIVAAYGLALEARRVSDRAALERAADRLARARPTARNLAWAVGRVRAAALAAPPEQMAAAARAEAERVHAEDAAASAAIARHGADLLGGVRRVLTHCNTGALAAAGRGTALAVIAELAERGPLEVLCCEARPLLQGARLTTWELRRLGIPHALVVDAAAPGLLARNAADAVIVGCDRVAASGDVANKVGTYGLALAARAAGIPFVVAGPTSSIDLATPDGGAIEIEERDPDEVRRPHGVDLAPAGTACRNPAFDVTPAALISALVTERGVARPVEPASVARVAAPSP